MSDRLVQVLAAALARGEVAMRLVERDPAGARREVEGMLAMVRSALREMRTVVRATSLRRAVDGGVTLLAAAGIRTEVRFAVGRLPRRAEELLTRAVREGVAEVLSHGGATRCRIEVTGSAGAVRLELVSDATPRLVVVA